MIRIFDDDFYYPFTNTLTITSPKRAIYNPETHDLVPKKEYVQEEIDRLSETLKSLEKARENYIDTNKKEQEAIKEKIAVMQKRLK